MVTYYDYNRDFPKGCGWHGFPYDYQFTGAVISSPDYVFERGKYAGATLQNIVSRCWKGVIKYIDHGLIFITKECREQMVCDIQKLRAINIANDSKLTFCGINWVFDELYSKPFACTYQGVRFIDVAQNDPRYLIGLLGRAFMPRYGQNQRFYATDKCDTIVCNENWLGNIIDYLQHEGVDKILISYLIDLDENIKAEREVHREWMEDKSRAEMDRYEKEQANRDFEDLMNDFDAWGNID